MSEPSSKLSAALVEARKLMQSPKLDAKAQGRGGREYKYASLASVLEAIIPPLLGQGVFFSQPIGYEPGEDGGLVIIENILIHENEHWTASVMRMPCDGTPHGVGQAVTYGKRYSALAIFAIVGEEADDATELQAAVVEKKAAKASGLDKLTIANSLFKGTVRAAITLGLYKEEQADNVEGMLAIINELLGAKYAQPAVVGFAALERATQELKDRIKITEAERAQK